MDIVIRRGTCHVLYAYDIGMAINLKACQSRLAKLGRATLSGRHRRAPKVFGYDPPPLTIIQESAPQRFGQYEVSSSIDLTFYDFGAVSISYEIPMAGTLDGLCALSGAIAQSEALLHDSHRRVEELQRTLGKAVELSQIAALVEDYAIFEITECDLPCPADELPKQVGAHWQFLGAATGNIGGNPPSLVKLYDSRLALTYGYRLKPSGVRARISSDEGRTWGQEIILRDDGLTGDLGYPRSVVRSDGKILTVYYFNGPRDEDRTIQATIWSPSDSAVP